MEQSFSPSNITDASSPYPDSQQSPPQLKMASSTPALQFKQLMEKVKVDKR
jgi:hypothetical protein